MKTEELLNNLKQAERKYEGIEVKTGQLNISHMLCDVIPAVQRLHAIETEISWLLKMINSDPSWLCLDANNIRRRISQELSKFEEEKK